MLLELGVSLIITMVSYLAFPIFYRYLNGRVGTRKGKKLALWNSIVCEIIFTIGGFAIGVEPATNGTMFAQGFLYYFIAKFILVDPSIKEEPIEDKNALARKTETAHLCDSCGMQMFSDEEKCSNCGKENPNFGKEIETKFHTNTAEKNRTNIVKKKEISIIKGLQIAVVSVFAALVMFAIIYPISINSAYKSDIPPITQYKTEKLTDLDANKKVYCEMDGKYNYLYVKDEYGQIWIYRFINTTMYTSSNGVKKGYATSVQLKEYFSSNIYSGKPTLTYVMPAAVPVGISVSIVLLGASIVMLIMIHRMAEEQIFKLRKNDEDFKRIHENFKTEEISKYEHQKLTKELFSNKILKNNKFFKLFTKIY